MNLTNTSRTDESDENLTFICKSSSLSSSDEENVTELQRDSCEINDDDGKESRLINVTSQNDSDCEYYDAVSKLSMENQEEQKEEEEPTSCVSGDLKKLSDDDEMRIIEMSRCQIEKFKLRERSIDSSDCSDMIRSISSQQSMSSEKKPEQVVSGADRNELLRNELIELRIRHEREERAEQDKETSNINTSQYESETKSQQLDVLPNTKHFNFNSVSGVATTRASSVLQAPMVVIDEMNTSSNIPEEEDSSLEFDKFKTWPLNSSMSGSKPNVVVVEDDDEEEEILLDEADMQITGADDTNDAINPTNESMIIDEEDFINPVDKFIHFSSLKKRANTSDTSKHHHNLFHNHHFHYHKHKHRIHRKINKTSEDNEDGEEVNNEEMNVDDWAEGYHENANFGDTSEDCLDDSEDYESQENHRYKAFDSSEDEQKQRGGSIHQRDEQLTDKTENHVEKESGGETSSSNVRFIDENSNTGGGSGNLSGPTHSSSLSSKTSLSRAAGAESGGVRTSFRLKTKETFMGVLNKFEKAVKHMQHKADERLHHDKEANMNSDSDSDDANINESAKAVKYKAARSNKATHEFEKTHIVQILNSNYNQPAQNSLSTTPNSTPSTQQQQQQQHKTSSDSVIWSMKFSPCGKLLATAGKDQKILIWVLKSYYSYFLDQFHKHNYDSEKTALSSLTGAGQTSQPVAGEEQSPFCSQPFLTFLGHTSDIIDLSWSNQLFLLSASSDKTCRLWHVYKNECLCIFHHNSIISAVSFHPKDDRFFLTACLDGKLRFWNMSEKKVLFWNDLTNLNETTKNFITAICFCQGGKTIAVGTFSGKCILYNTEHLKYYSLINVRSTRGRNSKGSKITGIEVLNNDENKILITSNDSRIRIYDLRDSSLHCKYKGFANSTVHIKASLSPDDRFILCGSKNKCTYFWKTNYQYSMLSTGRRDRNNCWERIQVHNAVVTSALFAPKPQLILNQLLATPSPNTSESQKKSAARSSKSSQIDHVYVMASAAGCDGLIKICISKSNFVS